jgi:hypothetical protein
LIYLTEAVIRGESIHQAAIEENVNRSTLRRRILSVQSREEFNKSRQTLSSLQEAWLAESAIIQSTFGHPPPLSYFKHYAQRILKYNGIFQTLGKHWYTKFLELNPKIKSARARLLGFSRANAATSENINLFFDRLSIPELQNISPRHIWNADEMGIMMGIGDNGIVVRDVYRKFLISKHLGNRE